ncbi:AraC family transcriptional regulator [Vibrio mangrovi]|uniref:Helix-turn-helix domain-containing protein n=1 Tax=Vibrio mangrovi TaxID=474394 RepID=A0A1Y6IUA8_9VIBR|nr:AraC family transcriptional regulator [Vibrio mangrovi]MDW6001901.1 helix-turn-helix domain-containing protein [Vibrio mangrovi]SMS00072.1 Luminescence regulatory protein LuxO [Vibrio mangrovi]
MIKEPNHLCYPSESRDPATLNIGKDFFYPILGDSNPMKRIKQQIRFASEVSFPVFISGESGCEKKDVAYNIHYHSQRCREPFVCVPANIHDARAYREHLCRCIDQACGGSVYLEEVDSLEPLFKDELIFLFTLDAFQEKLRKNRVRLIISCTEPFYTLPTEQQFIAKILGSSVPQFNFHLPPLRERKQDIEQHIKFIFSRLDRQVLFSVDAMEMLKKYEWPGNISQLQNILLSIIALAKTEITADDLDDLGICQRMEEKEDLIEHLIHHDQAFWSNMHPALSKALLFLSQHFQEDISLNQIAGASYTSASHLSYLFREHLGSSFKSLLCQLRVREAQHLMTTNPLLKITDVCMSAGFGDLSHFEKMFKRYVGCTPRQFRQEQRQESDYSMAC